MVGAILAVDPGRGKCGLALVDGPTVVARRVVSRDDLGSSVRMWRQMFAIAEVVVGRCTSAEDAAAIIRQALPDIPLTLVDERGTTLEARRLYFAEHPRRGWRRLLPVGLQVPPEPYDDYAAVVLARRRFARGLPANLDRASRKQEESP